LLGVALATATAAGAILLQLAFRLMAIQRSQTAALRPLVTQAAMLVGGAAVEELLTRVGLCALLTMFLSRWPTIVVSAAVFSVPHALRGDRKVERYANIATAFVFGVLLGWVWLATHSFAFIVSFHAAYNIVGGLVLGWVSVEPIAEGLPAVSWPFALRYIATGSEARLFVAYTASEVIALAAAAAVLRGVV
jgi:membrane protease YdiL (CAAX protease family)